MNMKTMLRWSALSAPLSVIFMTAPIALMPETGWSEPIDVMTVSVRRRDENAQDIPVSVSAFDSDFIEKQGVFSTKDVVKLVPGVQFDQGFSAADTRISIRGINNSRGRASVAMLIDGIDISGENITAGGGGSLLNTKLLDLERIEVIKGPQAALYGRNAFAGAINYVTKQPSMDGLVMNISGEAAEYDTYNLRGSISGPIIADTLAASLNVAGFSSEGYYDNNISNQPVNDFGQPVDAGNTQELNGSESVGMRLAVLWTPTENLDITGAFTYSEDESDPRAVAKVGNANQFYLDGARLAPGTAADFSFMGTQDYGQWLGTVDSVEESDVMLSQTGTGGAFSGSEDDRMGASLKINWDIGPTTLKSITSYLNNEAKLYEDADFQNGLGTGFEADPVNFPGAMTYLSLANDYQDETDTTQFTQDLILESNNWDRGIWLIGAQYFIEEVENKDFSLGWNNDPSLFFAPGYCGTDPFQFSCDYAQSLAGGDPAKSIDRDTDSYSLYGMLSFDFTEKLSASVEVRYVHDEIEVTTNTAIDRVSQYFMHVPIDLAGIAPQPVPLPESAKQTTSDINPRFALDYKFTDQTMIYGSVAKGTKPGGFGTSQMSRPETAKMDPETLWAYELGTKTTWFDQSLRVNAALFFNDYKDRQVGVTVPDPVTFWPSAGIVNAGAAETKGFELDVLWLANDYLTLGLGYAYTDAEWTDFNYDEIRPNGASDKDRAICQDPNGDCSGADIAGIPENALTLIGNWTQQISSSGLEWFLNGTAMWQDERAIQDRVDTPYVDDFWRVDGQLGIQNDSWSVMLFATNLLDDDTVVWGQGYQDFENGMLGGNFGGEPRDESVMAFLPDPRIIGVRATYRFGGK